MHIMTNLRVSCDIVDLLKFGNFLFSQNSIQGVRDLAMMSVFFLTGCRVSAATGACVGHLETDGVEHFLHVTEKRNQKRR